MAQSEMRAIQSDITARLEHLRQQLESLHAERDILDGKIREFKRQVSVWQQALQLEMPEGDRLKVDPSILQMRLSDAIDHMRRENPDLSRELAETHLQAAGYDFKGKKPSAAIHFAWLNVNKRRGKNGTESD